MRSDSLARALLGARPSVLVALAASPRSPRKATGSSTDTSRIVSVGGSITEIVYALGEEERLVARDSTSVYPRSGA